MVEIKAVPAQRVERALPNGGGGGEQGAAQDADAARLAGNARCGQSCPPCSALCGGKLFLQLGGFGGKAVLRVEADKAVGAAVGRAVVFAGQFDVIGRAAEFGDEIEFARRVQAV